MGGALVAAAAPMRALHIAARRHRYGGVAAAMCAIFVDGGGTGSPAGLHGTWAGMLPAWAAVTRALEIGRAHV